ncbi:DUF2975 domain-containing protein [Agromyces sp. Leaf222]|uniref:DUF2975 domain-containing protein n=1 Tax=Agromyces sp. Leaf222 TaxID=1735688 RepID=UPI0006F7F55A|nr:DUF2975 domain-containing protein [Agromyces sp. Leaf222]KQM83922.1 hypothetical protein ASE68_12520 [Agromyces sp. Leaf222]
MDYDLPRPSRTLVIFTQSLLAVLFLVGVGALVLLPGISQDVAASLPEYADLRGPLLALAMAFIALALIALAMISLLVHRLYRGTVLARTSLLWVDVLVVSLACAVVLVITSFVVISNGQAGSPFLGLIQVIVVLVLVVLSCVTLVLRSLLRRAMLMRAELEEVI